MNKLATVAYAFQKVESAVEKRPVLCPTERRSPPRPVTLVASTAIIFRPREPKEVVPIPKLPPRDTISVQQGDGWVSRLSGTDLINGRKVEVELPFHTPRFVNGATMKALLGGRSFHTLLRKKELAWEICEDNTPIDLTDRSFQFRVGAVAVLS